MLKTAFYIVERGQLSGGEVKEVEPDPTEGLAPIEVCLVAAHGGQRRLGEHRGVGCFWS